MKREDDCEAVGGGALQHGEINRIGNVVLTVWRGLSISARLLRLSSFDIFFHPRTIAPFTGSEWENIRSVYLLYPPDYDSQNTMIDELIGIIDWDRLCSIPFLPSRDASRTP